jgi:hypothetical protein
VAQLRQLARRLLAGLGLARRDIFGTHENDGEVRQGITLDQDKMLLTYSDVAEEIKAWYAAYFAPALLDKQQAQALGITGVDSQWHDNISWSIPSWGAIATNSVPEVPSIAEFTVLLRGYVMGQSDWEYILSVPQTGQGSVAVAGVRLFTWYRAVWQSISRAKLRDITAWY